MGKRRENAERIIKSKERVKSHGEVFTPERIVKKMCDMLQENNEEDVFRVESTFLEPSCGNGNFLVEILGRKLKRCNGVGDCLIAIKSIYGIDILPDNIEESKKRMLDIVSTEYGFLFAEQEIRPILDKQIVCGDSLKIMKELQEKEWEDIFGG